MSKSPNVGGHRRQYSIPAIHHRGIHPHSCTFKCEYDFTVIPLLSIRGPSKKERPEERQDSAYFSGKGEEALARLQNFPNTLRGALTSSPPSIATHDERSLQTDVQRSKSDDTIQLKQVKAREKVVVLREGVMRMRRATKSHRVELRKREEDLRNAIDKITRKISEIVTSGKFEDISVLHDAVTKAKDRLGPVDAEYEKLELSLEDQEWSLEEEEAYFYRYHNASADMPEARIDTMPSPRTRGYQASEVDSSMSNLENELMQDYLNKIADVEWLKEELDELESDFVRFSEEADFRRKHFFHLSKELSIFFEEYVEVHANLLHKVHATEDEIFDLRDKCIDKGIFGDNEHKYVPYSALYEECMEPVYYAQDRSPLRVAARRGIQNTTKLDYGDKQDSVNCWILDWVQESAINALMLKTEIYHHLSELPNPKESLFNDDKWADMAIENWHRDGMGVLASENFNASKLDQIFGTSCISQGTSTGCSGVTGIIDSLRSFKINPEFAAELETGLISGESVNLESEPPQLMDHNTSSSLEFVDTTISEPQQPCRSLRSSPISPPFQSQHQPLLISI